MVAIVRSLSAPTSSRLRQRRGLHNFAPGEQSVAGEQRRDMPAAVDRRDMEGVGEAVETQGARERDHVPAVDEPPAEASLALAELVEMHLGGVLIEPGRRLVLGLFDGDAVDMIDPFAGSVVLEPIGRPAELSVEGGAVDPRTGRPRLVDVNRSRAAWERGPRARRRWRRAF